MLIDTHCHLNDPEAFPDPGAALQSAHAAGVDQVIVVGVDEETSRSALEMSERYDGVFAVVGWHPNYTANYREESLRAIEEMAKHPRALAIGEIGLDFHWQYATLEEQQRALFDQLDLAQSAGKPVVFHCREAYPALLDVLERREKLQWLFHCFAGDVDDAHRAVALDAFFGVDGPITYKKASLLRDVVRTLPRDRLVVETDSPYLTPEPHRGKPNQPAYVSFVNGGLASTLEITPEECADLTTANAVRFFKGL